MITRGLGTSNIVTRGLGPWSSSLLWRIAKAFEVWINRIVSLEVER